MRVKYADSYQCLEGVRLLVYCLVSGILRLNANESMLLLHTVRMCAMYDRKRHAGVTYLYFKGSEDSK